MSRPFRGRTTPFFVVAALLLPAACGRANQASSSPPAADPSAAEASPADTPTADATPATEAPPTPPELAEGERLFDVNCARCHGPRATGTDQGPPLVHVIYEPNHHSDAAFQMAAMNGVRAHHWSFGDMPPVPGVTPEQVTEIVAYLRWLQRQAGIIH